MCTTTTMSLTMENSFFRKYCKVISLQLIKINEKRKKNQRNTYDHLNGCRNLKREN